MEKRQAVYNAAADKRWNEQNKEHRRYLSYRGTTKTFIRKHATSEDLQELKELIKNRKEELEDV